MRGGQRLRSSITYRQDILKVLRSGTQPRAQTRASRHSATKGTDAATGTDRLLFEGSELCEAATQHAHGRFDLQWPEPGKSEQQTRTCRRLLVERMNRM